MLELLKDIFLFSESKPLIFTQMYFWVFLAVVMGLYTFLHKDKKVRHAYLLLVSLFFYYKTSGLYVSLLIFSTLVDFFLAKAIHRTPSPGRKKLLLAASVVVNLFVLSYFKYAGFFIDSVNGLLGTDWVVHNHLAELGNLFAGGAFDVDKIILPVGVSFFTFQTISYTVDVYRGKLKPEQSMLDFGFYVSFFPQLVAGPIVKAGEFLPQLQKEYSLSRAEFGMALFMILKGLFKKMFISDYIAVNFIDRVFSNPTGYSGFENLMALYSYSLQVYLDFSGYTDIAIGVALLFGFHLSRNFNSPYKAEHVGDFWRRWHISLSTWLRDYLYIPLGGSQKGKFRTNVNLMITMLLGGLWHGASWQFVIWGALNGVGLVIYKHWQKISPFRDIDHWLAKVYGIFLTFHFITFTRIWFRAESMDDANALMYQIANAFGFDKLGMMLDSYKNIFAMVALGFVTHWLSDTFKDRWRDRFIAWPHWVKGVVVVAVVMAIYQVRTAELQPFIYFQF